MPSITFVEFGDTAGHELTDTARRMHAVILSITLPTGMTVHHAIDMEVLRRTWAATDIIRNEFLAALDGNVEAINTEIRK